MKQGCDGSILLNGVGEDDEKQHHANFALREEAMQTLENLCAIIRGQCPRVVSCADILVFTVREVVHQVIFIHSKKYVLQRTLKKTIFTYLVSRSLTGFISKISRFNICFFTTKSNTWS